MNVLVVKELSGVSRRWQTYLGRVVYMALIALFLLPILLRRDLRSLSNPSEFAAIGRNVFYALFTLQMVFVPLMAVSAASDMVSKEIRAGTLGLLALTPLTPRRIVSGKWRAAVLYSFSLFLCGIPVLATCVYLGGVGVLELVWSTCLTGACAALAGAVSILYSSILRAGYTAVISGVLTLAGYTILPALFMTIVREKEMFEFLMWLHPVYAAIGAAMGGSLRLGSETAWIGATIVTLLLTWLILRRAARVVARKILIMDRDGRRTDVNSLSALSVSTAAPVWDTNAILWKELRTRKSAGLRKATRIGLIVLGVILLIALMASGGVSPRFWQWFLLWFGAGFFLLMAMASGVSLFVREKEGRQWEVLLSTPLTAWQIIVAKFTAGLLNLGPLALLFFGVFTLVALADPLPFIGWMMTASSLVAVSAFAYTLGAAMSLRAATMRAAFSATFGFLGLVLFFLPIVLAVYGAFDRGWTRAEFPFVLMSVSHPATFMVPLTSAMFDRQWRGAEIDREFIELIPFFLVHLALYAAGILSLVIYMRARFAGITGRSDGE